MHSLGRARAGLYVLLTMAACGSSDDNCTTSASGVKTCTSDPAAPAKGKAGAGGKTSASGGSGGSGSRGGAAAQGGVGGSGGPGGGGGQAAVGGGGGNGGSAPARCFKRPLFNADQPWNERIDSAAKDSQSDTIISALQQRGWGLERLQIDFSLDVLCAPAGTALRDFQQTDDFYEGDCDVAKVPVPANGHLEGESGYRCTNDGDCHLIVIAQDTNKLYEQWRVDIDQSSYRGGCLAVWQLDKDYDAELRGDQCTSADAAGLPIAPLLFDADEVESGAIEHAVRFALPNTHIRNRTYVRPATHATGAASAGTDGVPYGARLRLRADYPLDSLPNDGARTLARALQHYGMILADGGDVALMGQDDRSTTAKWDGLLAPRDLQQIKPSDFELVEAGERFTWQGDCVLK